MDHRELAAELFLSDCNCAQAVLEAFSDVTGLEKGFAAKLASSFGGGMGRMREVCGAVSGMLMVAGLLYGYDDPGENDVNKKPITGWYRPWPDSSGRRSAALSVGKF